VRLWNRKFRFSTGIAVDTEFRTNLSGYSMKTISGKWVEKAK